MSYYINQSNYAAFTLFVKLTRAESTCRDTDREDERGIHKTARCAVLPCEMSKRIRPAFAVPEAAGIPYRRREGRCRKQ